MTTMVTDSNHLRKPFGEVSCEAELARLKDRYPDYYFTQAPFNGESVSPETYLIIGRRGSGKTSLAHYFTFQQQIPNCHCIDVEEPEFYQAALKEIAEQSGDTKHLAIPSIVKIWEYTIWQLIFKEYGQESPAIAEACAFSNEERSFARIIRETLRNLLRRFLNDEDGVVATGIERMLMAPVFTAAKRAVLQVTQSKPIIVAIDSLEHYNIGDEAWMNATAALVQCAAQMNVALAEKGIHVKVFMTAEAFPHLEENFITNTLKYVRKPVYLHWRVKDLMRLVSWRLHRYLADSNHLFVESAGQVPWDDFDAVLAKMWTPYFGEFLTNHIGLAERTFPYVFRHTQMRPRQLIELCNAIATLAMKEKTFPRIRPETIVQAVGEQEKSLANEVVNSYSSVYKDVGQIIMALSGIPMVFGGNVLDKVARKTAALWPQGEYSPLKFRQLVAELGIVGRVREFDESTRVVTADFEYFQEDRLSIQVTDRCVIHPMFYKKLNVTFEAALKVYPFPWHVNHPHIQGKSAN